MLHSMGITRLNCVPFNVSMLMSHWRIDGEWVTVEWARLSSSVEIKVVTVLMCKHKYNQICTCINPFHYLMRIDYHSSNKISTRQCVLRSVSLGIVRNKMTFSAAVSNGSADDRQNRKEHAWMSPLRWQHQLQITLFIFKRLLPSFIYNKLWMLDPFNYKCQWCQWCHW